MDKIYYYKPALFLIAFVLISIIFSVCAFAIKNTFSDVLISKNNAIASERMVNLANSIDKDYQIVFKNANRLTDYIVANQDADMAQIENFIQKILMPKDLSAFFNNKNNAFIRAYVVAPDDIVSFVHPQENRSNSSVEYFTDSASDYYRKLAKFNPSDVIVQGPILTSKYHDSLIFNRQAVFIDDKYWGYIGVIVDFNKFLECVKLNVEDQLFVYALRSLVHKGNNDFIWGDNSLFKYRSKNSRQKTLYVGKQRWDLSLRIKSDADSKTMLIVTSTVVIVLYIITLVLAFLLIELFIKNKESKKLDHLTNTLNHATFMELVKNELKTDEDLALVCVELVHFKQVNNTFGYKTGDEILTIITKRLESIIGYNDKICRIGAEILVFMKNIKSVIDVERVCFEIKDKLNAPLYLENYAVKQPCVIGSANTIESGHDYWTLCRNLNENLDVNRLSDMKNATLKIQNKDEFEKESKI